MRDCPVCGASASIFLLQKETLRLVRCADCSMMYATPVPSELASGLFYERRAEGFYLSPDKVESDYAPPRFERELKLFRAFCPAGAVLDVGCSNGAFLFQLQNRWPGDYRVVGTDITSSALAYAESRGIEIVRGPFLASDFQGRRFEAITFWAVMEHLLEPARFLSKAAGLLNPSGHCFVLVPNMRSVAVRLLNARYRYIMPEHLNYFTPSTLRAFFAAEPAFDLVALRSTHFNPIVIWQDFWQRPGVVPDAERARLLRRTTGLKQNSFLAPLKRLYEGVEWCLGQARLADNLTAVLRLKKS